MERRKILLGSGAVLTTALAGCTGSDGDDDDPDDTESADDGEPETDNNNAETDENGSESDGESEGDGENDGDGETDDVPGFDGSQLDLESDLVTITGIERAGDTVEIVADSETADLEKLYGELEALPEAHKAAAVDIDALADEIETIEWVVDHENKKVVSFTVKVEWLVYYEEGDITRDQLFAKIKDTAE